MRATFVPRSYAMLTLSGSGLMHNSFFYRRYVLAPILTKALSMNIKQILQAIQTAVHTPALDPTPTTQALPVRTGIRAGRVAIKPLEDRIVDQPLDAAG